MKKYKRKVKTMNWDNIQQLVRILAQLGAGVLLQRGIITEDIATQLIGGAVSIASVAWWLLWNSKRS